MAEDKLIIKHGTVPDVLMIGNGFNRAFHFASWDDLIESIRTKELSENEKEGMKKVPYPLQPVILTGDHLGTQMKKISVDLTELKAPAGEEKLLQKFAELPVQAVLTANYTYELEKAVISDFKCIPGRACKFRKNAVKAGDYETRMLHTYFAGPEEDKTIWHIHGEAAKPDTMVLGHYYYGKLLEKMQQYIPKLQARFNGTFSSGKDYVCHSWIDYFMLGNVYIVGLGMDMSELDLWWLINCKKRHYPETKVTLFKPNISPELKLLAEAYGVKVDEEITLDGDEFLKYYEQVLALLKRKLNGEE